MVNIILKRATIDNLKDVQILNNKLFEYEHEGWDKDLELGWSFGDKGTKYFTDMINNEFVYIAFDNDKPIGYLAGTEKAANTYITVEVAEIDNMFVDEDYRGLQVGTMLINRFKEYCIEKGITTFKVNASCENKKAIEFYKKNGFSEHDVTLWCRL